MASKGILAATLQSRRQEILGQWSKQLDQRSTGMKARLSASEVNRQAEEFLNILTSTAQGNDLSDVGAPGWLAVRTFLDDLSRQRVLSGFSSDETATFIFSLKRPL